MTDTKRAHTEFSSESPQPEKELSKRGRKPIDTEPKSKRTAQNRAAQRAYRERKERKMKDLEDKVALLEDERTKATTELDLLRAQVELLKKELSRFRGNADFTDLKLPQSVPTAKNSSVKREIKLPSGNLYEREYSLGFPWANQKSDPSGNKADAVPDLVSGSSSSTSPLDNSVLVSPDSNTSDSFNNLRSSLSPQNQFNTTSDFDEKLDPFCVTLGEACGTKQQPVPKYRRTSQLAALEKKTLSKAGDSPLWSALSPFHAALTPNENLSDPFFAGQGSSTSNDNDPLSFLNDNNFDVSLAFGNATNDFLNKSEDAEDPLARLTTEESIYDPIGNVNTDFNFNEFVKSSLPSEASSGSSISGMKSGSSITSFGSGHDLKGVDAEGQQDVVPAPEKVMRCLEIWDRITSHPRYSDIDIDGLCYELKSKAKCSEKGVVIDAKDVNSLLARSALNH